jgi:tRNA(adenine34) deaminase
LPDYYQRIKQKYDNLQGDSTELFGELMRISNETGMDDALAYLERCVIEKRLAWLKTYFYEVENRDGSVVDGYRWFYEKYLRVSVPKDGEIVETSENRIVMHWWNPCPTLEACKKFGLDTREICKKVYQRPVQEFLQQINPRLRFTRNYEYIRPHTEYCEEIIELIDEKC